MKDTKEIKSNKSKKLYITKNTQLKNFSINSYKKTTNNNSLKNSINQKKKSNILIKEFI